jgi:predicted acyltransferase
LVSIPTAELHKYDLDFVAVHAPEIAGTRSRGTPTRGDSCPSPEPGTRPRLASLDALRGAAIAGMVLVNFPAGGPGNYYHELTHSTWNGLTFADTVFPAFLFMVGVSTHFSLDRYIHGGVPRRLALVRIGRRVVLLFALGLLVNGFAPLLGSGGAVLANLRIPGVLQRIAIAYLLAALAVLYLRPRYQVVVALCLLLGYWAALSWVSVPGYGAGVLTPHGNVGAWVDRTVFGPAHMWQSGTLGYDPEGLLGSIVAASGVLFGYWTGMFLRIYRSRRVTLGALASASIFGTGVGLLWSRVLPINKSMWTPSYVMLTAGLTLGALTVCHLLFDGKRRFTRALALPLRVLGSNAIVLYVGTELTGSALNSYHHAMGSTRGLEIPVWLWYRYLEPTFGRSGGSLVFALAVLGAWSVVVAIMYRLRWFVRV